MNMLSKEGLYKICKETLYFSIGVFLPLVALNQIFQVNRSIDFFINSPIVDIIWGLGVLYLDIIRIFFLFIVIKSICEQNKHYQDSTLFEKILIASFILYIINNYLIR